ncbi:HNH endonuclease domain protein [Coleofasciculus chthonoplastes PCC 7420]|uniref:HNH endonuclease domain protein n=1 Tax=Coleofasciculus chthonoplastes PCC 7420 TaxID=118168 RepID=B4VUG9_9CYAN|nr:HNH endonuclease signature motif containing protein [Coleofasciculus chthonoplastes]EDX74487.1 HNH endonuclease domain protein [Coleofasciculus chthonoplastes PCC 7420]
MSEPKLTAKQKEAIARRADGCCEYCRSQARFSPDPFSIEHITPRSKGGTDENDNLALACQGCNNRKYTHIEARDPVSGNLVSLYHPRRQRWADQFSWNEDFTIVIGLTPTGRPTVERLQLNREGVVNLRRVLRTIGQHPPIDSDQV